jgi:PAS domain S-box-containing protein
VEIADRVSGSQGAVLPICGEQVFLADLEREGYACTMLIPPNRIRRLAVFVLFCVAWFNAGVGGPLEALSAVKENVLVLYGEPLSVPANRMTEQGLTAGLSREYPGDVEIFSEYLNFTRFPRAQFEDDLVRYLRARYATRKPDVVIAVEAATLQFATDQRDKLFPGVPIVFLGVDHREVEGKEMPPNVTGIWMAWDYQRTVELALQLQPETREIVCVCGTGIQDQLWNNEARKVPERFTTRVRTRWLDKLPLQAVLDEVARLSLDSVVLYISMWRDGAGESVSPFEVARQLAKASRVPVYGLSRPQLEQGLIGGALQDFSETGREAAALAFRVLAGERPPLLLPPDPRAHPLLVNWRALKKWHVSESRIPGEATVLYRDPSLWEQHPRLIVATAAIVGLQSLLIVGLIIQRSKLKRAEAALRESGQHMGLAASAAELAMWTWDILRDQIWTTDKGNALFGFAKSDKINFDRFLDALHPEDRETVRRAVAKAMNGDGEYESAYRVVLSDGQVRWIAGRGRVEFGDGKPLRMRGVSLDITERRQAELEAARQRTDLAHASRLAIVGELTASIAHEINQPLGAILSNAETAEILLQSKQPHLEEIQHILADIRKDDLRASEVIRRMRELLRKRELEFKLIDLNVVASDVFRFVDGETHRRGVEIEKQFADTLPVVRGDVIHLQQVLLNLILNGMEAMSESSKSNRRLTIRTAYDGKGNIEVAVEDSGPGIPSERLPRLFDSFFTTKTHGMGLGLSIVRSIVEAHGGRIWAENNASGGACFRFTLPVNGKE